MGIEQQNQTYKTTPISDTSHVVAYVTSKCELTAEKLNIADPKTKILNCKEHIEGIKLACQKFEISSCLRKAHFLAQTLHESAHLKRTKEMGDEKYFRSKNYYPYIGRGLIQLTKSENYKAYGAAIGAEFLAITNMNKLEKAPHAAQSAGWFWKNGVKSKQGVIDLNLKADKNDFFKITVLINGGFNGLDDRLNTLKSIFKEFNLTQNTDYKFNESEIYESWFYSFAWGLWHDNGTKKFQKYTNMDKKEKAIEGYERALELSADMTFPQKTTKGKIITYYEIENPKTYIQSRLRVLK